MTEAERTFATNAAGPAAVTAASTPEVAPEGTHFDERGRWLYRTVRTMILAVARLLGRIEVHGSEKVPATGPFILAPVHRSNVDFALVSLATKRRMRYMAKDSLWKSKPLGWFVDRLGAFPVARGTADRDALRVCAEVLGNGEPLVMFPEGSRRSGPVVEELFDGPAYLACKMGVPVVPMGIGGSEEMMPKGAKFLRPRRLVLTLGEPIVPPAPAEGKRTTSRKAVKALTEELHVEVQRLFDDAQHRAGNLP